MIDRWLRCYPLHAWAACGVIAWGWMTLWWVLLWEIGGFMAILRERARCDLAG